MARARAGTTPATLPQLGTDDVDPAFAGVRALLRWRDGRLTNDFAASRPDRASHIRDVRSQAATSSLAIARVGPQGRTAFGMKAVPVARS